MMNVLDTNLDGCCVRGLPIGKPFRTRFEVPKDYEASVTDTTDVFILLRYQDMQGGAVIDLLSETDRQEVPWEPKENTLKRRILNRQNLENERPADKQASESDKGHDSDIESVMIEELLELHVDSETGNSFYTVPTSSHIGGLAGESDIKSDNVFDMCQDTESTNLDHNDIDEELLSGTDKIIHALVNRETGDKSTANDKDDYSSYHCKSTSETVVECKTQETCVQNSVSNVLEQINNKNSSRISKRKADENNDLRREKLKEDAENSKSQSRRVSQRLKSPRHRSDIKALEKLSNIHADNEEDDDTDNYDLDNEKSKETMSKKKCKQKKKGPQSSHRTKSESNNINQDVKPDLNKLNASIKTKLNCKSVSQNGKISKSGKKRLSKVKDDKTSDSVKKNNKEDKEPKSRNGNDHIPDSGNENEFEDDPDDPDFKPSEGKHKKVPLKQDAENVDDFDEENLEGPTQRKLRKKHSKSENHSVSKPKQGNKTTDSTMDKTDENDSSQLESDPDLVGLAKYKKNILLARRKKIIEQQEKQATRIKVKLHEHMDKWKKDIMDSYMRKDRGKARYEVAVEMYVCLVCDKYKAESKESMENHIEMHVNGDLQCNHPDCTYIAVTNFELQKHKRDIHKKNIWICDLCGLETIGREGLKDHLGKVHDSPQWSCKLCLEQNDTKYASVTLHEHKKHLRAAHPESMFRCDGCKRLFAQQHKLDNHLKLGCEGEGRRSFACEKCGKVFSSQDSVKRHIMRVHNKERSFQCPYCPFTAARQTNLTSHLNVHEGYHPFKCDQCTFSCVQKYQLKSHMRTHSGEKPYKCTQCNYAAAWNVQLKDHIKAHSLPDAVTCELCNIVFKDVRALKTHETKEHGMSHSGSGSHKAVKTSPEPDQIIVNYTTVPQSYAQVINYSNPYVPAQHPLPYLAHYAAPFE